MVDTGVSFWYVNYMTLRNLITLYATLLLGLLLGFLYFLTPLTPKEIYTRVSPAIVMLTDIKQTHGGTGFYIKLNSGKRVIVTNHHVCDGNDEMLTDRDEVVTVLKTDPEHDLCVLESTYQDHPYLTLSLFKPAQFDDLYVVGHPLLHPLTPSTGLYLRDSDIPIAIEQHFITEDVECPEGTVTELVFLFKFCVRTFRLSETTVIIYPGNSGSAIVNSFAEVVGVINSGDSETHYGNFIPLIFLVNFIESLPNV